MENDTGNDPITDGDIAEVTSDDVAPSPSYLSKSTDIVDEEDIEMLGNLLCHHRLAGSW